VLGALIGHLIDSRKTQSKWPEHISDPEIQALAPSDQKSLRGSTLLVKIPFAGLSAKCTRLGFTFDSNGQPSLSYSGFVHKKKILGFLQERRILTATD
jgi:hypothetical protein